jgi:hypothetical protein
MNFAVSPILTMTGGNLFSFSTLSCSHISCLFDDDEDHEQVTANGLPTTEGKSQVLVNRSTTGG